jgi:hypothetical protein
VFENPHHEWVDSPFVWEILRREIRGYPGSMESVEQQEELRRKLFKEDYGREYGTDNQYQRPRTV